MSLVSVVIEISILSNFYRVSYRQNWRRDFLEVETKHQIKQASEGGVSWLRETSRGSINLTNPRLARTKPFAEQRLNLSVV